VEYRSPFSALAPGYPPIGHPHTPQMAPSLPQANRFLPCAAQEICVTFVFHQCVPHAHTRSFPSGSVRTA